MPIWFIIGFIAISLIFPTLARFTLIAPILGFTFGGFAWAIGGFFGLASFTFSSFLIYFGIAYACVLYLTRDK